MWRLNTVPCGTPALTENFEIGCNIRPLNTHNLNIRYIYFWWVCSVRYKWMNKSYSFGLFCQQMLLKRKWQAQQFHVRSHNLIFYLTKIKSILHKCLHNIPKSVYCFLVPWHNDWVKKLHSLTINSISPIFKLEPPCDLSFSTVTLRFFTSSWMVIFDVTG